MRVCLDFDGPIHDAAHPVAGRRMGPPVIGSLAACERLLKQGHTLLIHTARVTSHPQRLHVNEWLDYYGFPKSIEVSVEKPMADVYIDDKAIRFLDWDYTLFVLANLSPDGRLRELRHDERAIARAGKRARDRIERRADSGDRPGGAGLPRARLLGPTDG